RKPVALGGIMGGQDSEVTTDTRALLLECALFQPQRVRRGSRALGLSTDASKRFERGVDPGIGAAAAARFLSLLLALCPDARRGVRRRRAARVAPRSLSLRAERCTRLVGVKFTSARCAEILESLEFGVQRGDPLIVSVPSWRRDVTLEDDLVEE